MKVCLPVQVLALPRFKEATTPPVFGEMVSVPSALVTEDTPVVRHVPFTAKHPDVALIPLENVEVAPPFTSSFKSVVLPVVLLRVRNAVEVVAKVLGEEVLI